MNVDIPNHKDDERDDPHFRESKRQEARDLITEIRELAAHVRRSAEDDRLGYPIQNAVIRSPRQ